MRAYLDSLSMDDAEVATNCVLCTVVCTVQRAGVQITSWPMGIAESASTEGWQR
jgi:hypothetical protein